MAGMIINQIEGTDSSVNRIASTCYGTCDTTAGTAAKVATLVDSQDFELIEGVTVHIKFTESNTVSSATLNVNSTGAYTIMRYDGAGIGANRYSSWNSGDIVSFTFDGTYWIIDRYQIVTHVDQTLTSSNASMPILMASNNSSDTTTTITGYIHRNNSITVNPYSGNLNVTKLKDIGVVNYLKNPYNSKVTAGTNGIKQYSLCARSYDGKYTSFTTDSGTGTKTFDTTTQFDFSKIYCTSAGSNVSADATTSAGVIYETYPLVNMRYSFNGVTTSSSTSTLTANLPVYLCVTKDGKIVSPYYTQSPTASTTTYYVLLGYMYDTYRMDLLINNPMYSYDGTNFTPVLQNNNKVDKSGDTMTGDLSFVGLNRSIKCRELPSSFDYAGIVFTDALYSMGLYTYNSNGTISSGIKMDAAGVPSDRITLYPSASAWRSALGLDAVYYNEDDSITFSAEAYPCVGYVTSGQQDAYFDITMPKLGNFINTISVTQFGCAVRLAQGGYLQKSNDPSNMLDGTIKITGTPTFKGNTLSICVNNPNKFIVSGNQSVFVTNNTPFVGYCQLAATFT